MLNTNKRYECENTDGLLDFRYEYHYDSESGSWICEESRRCGGPDWIHHGTYPASDIWVMFAKEMES